ncbi:MAG: TatD family hydrolase [Candidatus Methanofastidiosia archaeon]
MIITDNHMHLSEKGLHIEASKQFQRAGGTHLILVHNPDFSKKISDFEKAFKKTIILSERINKETQVTSYPIVGLHPAEFVNLTKKFSLKESVEFAIDVYETAGNFVSERKAIGLGEAGTPHFEVLKEIYDASLEVLKFVLKLSSELDCAVHLHTESLTEEKYILFGKLIQENGKPKRVIKHFSPPLIELSNVNYMMPSVIGTKDNVIEAISQSSEFLMETDYIDDPKRPGAVVGPKTVPKTTKRLLEDGFLTKEHVLRIHKENVERIYGISLE